MIIVFGYFIPNSTNEKKKILVCLIGRTTVIQIQNKVSRYRH